MPFGGTYHSYSLGLAPVVTPICRSALWRHILLLSVLKIVLQSCQCVAVPFGGTYHSYPDSLRIEEPQWVAVPFGGTYHSYTPQENEWPHVVRSQCPLAAHITPILTAASTALACSRPVAVPFGGTYHSYRLGSGRIGSRSGRSALWRHISLLWFSLTSDRTTNTSQCPLAAHITPICRQGIFSSHASAVAVPFGGTYHSYVVDNSNTNFTYKSQCPLAAHITPIRRIRRVTRAVLSQCPLAAHITPI